MKRWTISLALALLAMANVGLLVVHSQLLTRRQQLLEEHARLMVELAIARHNLERLEASVSPPDAPASLVPEEYSIAVVHVKPGCGEVAFYRKPGPYPVSASARLPDGTRPVPMSPIICGHCHRAAWPLVERPRRQPTTTSDSTAER